MSAREKIIAEIAALSDEKLAEIQALVESLSVVPAASQLVRKPGIMEELRKITFEGPPDFSENVDLYLSGEKSA